MGDDLVLEVLVLHVELVDHVLLLEHFQELLAVVELVQILNSVVNIVLKHLELVQGLVSEILGWRPIILHAL